MWLWWLGCSTPHLRWSSPDGQFEVVSHKDFGWGWVSMAPGQGSDAPGRVEVVRVSDGQSCGAARVPMVWMAAEVRFEGNEARLPVVAVWDLATCTVEPIGDPDAF